MVVIEWSETEIDRVFHALADATRRDIVARTLGRDQSVTGLAQGYAMSFAAVQKHVAVLTSAGLVRKERRGREQLVRAVPGTMRHAEVLLQRYEALWRERSAGIEAILEADRISADEIAPATLRRHPAASADAQHAAGTHHDGNGREGRS